MKTKILHVKGGFGTPLEIAEQSQQQQIVELLNQYTQDEIVHSSDDETDNLISLAVEKSSTVPKKRILARTQSI